MHKIQVHGTVPTQVDLDPDSLLEAALKTLRKAVQLYDGQFVRGGQVWEVLKGNGDQTFDVGPATEDQIAVDIVSREFAVLFTRHVKGMLT